MEGLTSNSRARVTVTLEIPVPDNWGGDCTVSQIHKQAIDSAREKLYALTKSGARIIGEPSVTMVLVDAK